MLENYKQHRKFFIFNFLVFGVLVCVSLIGGYFINKIESGLGQLEKRNICQYNR